MRTLKSLSCFLVFAQMTLTLVACASSSTSSTGSHPVDVFAKNQKKKIAYKSVYNQAEFDFSAGMYEPTPEDLEALQTAWISHGQSFPESKSMKEILSASAKRSQRIVLVALYASDFDTADLKRKELGWGVSPIPFSTQELESNDLVLRALMPSSNPWVRYFLVKYSAETWVTSSEIVISNRTNRVVLARP